MLRLSAVPALSNAPESVFVERPRSLRIRYSRAHSLVLAAADAAAFSCAAYAALALQARSLRVPLTHFSAELAIACFTIVVLGVYLALGLYSRCFSSSWRDEIYGAFTGAFFAAPAEVAVFFVWPLSGELRASLAPALLAGALFAGALRAIAFARGSWPDSHDAAGLRTPAAAPLAHACKRFVDVAGALAGLALVWPVIAAAFLAVYVETRGPVLYRQRRVGRGGRIFHMWKIRTMRRGAESSTGAVFATLNDRRLTRVGRLLRRLSIDELVQLVNVLRGDMSLVGPRPERPEFVERFKHTIPHYDERHCVRPGITGWAQISLPRVLDAAQTPQKLARDLYYVENWSVFFDCSILVKTAVEFVFHRAA